MYINPWLKYEYYPGDLSNGLGQGEAARTTRGDTLLAIHQKVHKIA